MEGPIKLAILVIQYNYIGIIEYSTIVQESTRKVQKYSGRPKSGLFDDRLAILVVQYNFVLFCYILHFD